MATTDKTVMAQAARTGDTVFVACKFPTGLHLDLFDIVDEFEQTPQGRRPIKVARRNGQMFIARGPRLPHGQVPTFPIISGFAITPGCPKDLWDKYYEQNKQADYVANHVVFAHSTLEGVTAMCREHAKVESGFQPLDMTTKTPVKMRMPDGSVTQVDRLVDPRIPARGNMNITPVETSDTSPNRPDPVPVDA